MNSFEPQVKEVDEQVRNNLTLTIDDLMPGDILATTTGGKSSGLIRWATRGPFSHAIMITFKGYAVDATPEQGVIKERLTAKLKQAKFAVVFRHRTASPDQTSLAASWAASQANKPYDYSNAALSALDAEFHASYAKSYKASRLVSLDPYGVYGIFGNMDADQIYGNRDDDSFFCSELIFRAFAVAHIPLVEQPATFNNPNRLLETTQLVRLGKLKWR